MEILWLILSLPKKIVFLILLLISNDVMTNSPFVIKQINMFSGWVYNLPKNNECTICRCNLNTPSLYNQEKGTDSYVVSGVCLHSFHQECIKPWVDKNKHCPICSTVWQYSQSNNNETIIKKNNSLPDLISLDNNTNINMNINKYMESIDDKYKNKYIISKSEKIMMNPIIDKLIYADSNNENKKIKIIKKIIDAKIIKHNFVDDIVVNPKINVDELKKEHDKKYKDGGLHEKIIKDDIKNKIINIFKKEQLNKNKQTYDLGDDDFKDDFKKSKNNPEDDSDYDIVD